MRLKQREANKAALEAALAFVDNADHLILFDDEFFNEETDGESRWNESVREKAKENAIRRIRGLIGRGGV